jgi:putative transposase
MTVLVRKLGEVVGTSRACTALGVPRPSYYRRRRPARRYAEKKRPPPPRALGPSEQEQVIEVLNSERCVDQAPAQVVAALLAEGIYHCSAHTVYRVLGDRGEVRERRNQLHHRRYQRPEFLATAPNQVLRWDITKLRVARK